MPDIFAKICLHSLTVAFFNSFFFNEGENSQKLQNLSSFDKKKLLKQIAQN